MRTAGRPTSRSTSSAVGARSRPGSCAPHCRVESQGPSRWMPATHAVLDQRAEREDLPQHPVERRR